MAAAVTQRSSGRIRTVMRILLLLVSSLALVAGCATAPVSSPAPGLNRDFARDIRALQRDLIESEITGSNVVWIVGRDRDLYRHVENSGKRGDRDITADTLFPIWSMSKPITIVAMMTLFEQGKFSFDDPVSKYIPCFSELQVVDGGGVRPAREPLLVEHLMSHRSGYSYYVMGGGSTDAPAPPAFDRPHPNQTRFDDLQQFCEVAAQQPLMFEPGSEFLYGINQAILGRLVEVLSGMSFADYLQANVFDPLEMTSTSFVLDDERRARLQPLWINLEIAPVIEGMPPPGGTIKGFTTLLNEMTYSPRSKAHFGGEGLVSCAADYARFCQMLVQGGVYKGRRVLSEDSIQRMVAPKSRDIFAPAMPAGMDMGYSVFVMRDASGEGTKAPAGVFGWSGYHNTHFWIDPENDLFALFMSRAREFSFDIPRRLRQALYGTAGR